jgi:hypothetical protein
MSVPIRTFAAARGPAVTQAFRLQFGILAILAGSGVLSACTWFSPDAGMGDEVANSSAPLPIGSTGRSPSRKSKRPGENDRVWVR